MFASNQLTPELVKKLGRRVLEGSQLFRQGDYGKTMFVVVEGFVRIYYSDGESEHLVSIVGPGEVIGEKAILDDNPYIRTFSAETKSECVILEVDSRNYKLLQTKYPDVVLRMLRQVFHRLNKANELISILQLKEPQERFLKYIAYYYKHHNAHLPKQFSIPMVASDIRYTANLNEAFVAQGLADLVKQKILTQTPTGFVLENESSLDNYSSTFRTKFLEVA